MPSVGIEYNYILTADEARTKKTQPTFKFKILSCKQHRTVYAIRKQFDEHTIGKKPDAIKALDAAVEIVKIALIGWSKMNTRNNGKPLPYDFKKIEDVLAPAEIVELMVMVESGTGDQIPKNKKPKAKNPKE